jgi:hypothetical protein
MSDGLLVMEDCGSVAQDVRVVSVLIPAAQVCAERCAVQQATIYAAGDLDGIARDIRVPPRTVCTWLAEYLVAHPDTPFPVGAGRLPRSAPAAVRAERDAAIYHAHLVGERHAAIAER